MTKFKHICEVCGEERYFTPQEAFKAGWDYPPNMGAWQIVSPRTCQNCTIDKTLWWEMVVNKTPYEKLTEAQVLTLVRIQNEVPQ